MQGSIRNRTTYGDRQCRRSSKRGQSAFAAVLPTVFWLITMQASVLAQVTVETATIQGTVQLGSEIISSGSTVSASSGPYSSSASISHGQTSGTYTLPVTADAENALTYQVQATIRTDSGRDFLTRRIGTVAVEADGAYTLDYFVSDPGVFTGNVTVTGGVITYAYLYAYDSALFSGYTYEYPSAGQSSASGSFPMVTDQSSIRCYGTVYLVGGASVSLSNQVAQVVDGSAECSWSVTAPVANSASIATDIEFGGLQNVNYYQVSYSGSSSVTQYQYSPFSGPGNFEQMDDITVNEGTYTALAYAWLNNYDDYFRFPYSSFDTNVTWNGFSPRVTTDSAAITEVGISACQSYMSGDFAFTGSASLQDLNSGQVYFSGKNVQFGPTYGGNAYDQLSPAMETYDGVVSSGEWGLSSLYARLYRPAGDIDGYLDSRFNYYPNAVQFHDFLCAETKTQNLSIPTGRVTIYISSDDGTTFTNPSLSSGFCELRDPDSNQRLYYFYPSAYTVGQVNVTEGSVTFEGPAGLCSNVRVQVAVGGASLTIGSINFEILPGADVISDIGGPSITVIYPQPDLIVDANEITVDGLVTDDVEVAGVVVNGIQAFLASSENDDDPAEMLFSADVPLPVKGPNPVVVIATDTSDKSAQTSFVVFNDAGPPEISFTPADGSVLASQQVPIIGGVTDDAGVDSVVISIDGVQLPLIDGMGALEVEIDQTANLTVGPHSISVSATDISARNATATHFFTVGDTDPPIVSVPADMLLEATSAAGAAAIFTASANDAVDGALTVLCTPASGTTFPLGTTTVNCSATDSAGNTGSASFNVTVEDTAPPSLTLPSEITAEATGPGGVAVEYVATASDLVSGDFLANCAPPSGSVFPLGVTSVLCDAEDDAGNIANGGFSVIVVDTTPPQLSLPPDPVVEATGPAGATVSFTASATDEVDGSLPVECIPASGSVFPLGQTLVECSAVDASGYDAAGSFTVNVVDTTPPVITVGPDITTTATGPAGAAVSFPASALDLVDQALAPECTPASGSTFGHGQTAVDCNATDNAGNSGSAGFTVTVLNASPTADDQAVTLDEDTPAGVTLTGADPDGYPAVLAFEVVDPPANGLLSGAAPDLIYTPDLHYFGADSFTFRTFDGASYSAVATVSITVDPVNDLPVISVDRASAGLQYSDTIGSVVISATDVDDALGLASAWTLNGGAATVGLPAALAVSGGCTSTDIGASPRTGSSCSWTFSGQMLQPSGDYDVAFTVTDEGGDAGGAASASAATELLVAAENASIAFDGDNPVAVPVIADGVDASEPFSLLFQLRETPPDAASFAALTGDISQVIPEVSVKLTPVGPGSTVNGVCTASDNGQSGYAEVLTFACDFDAAPVNTYSVDVLVNGGYYVGSDDDVLTVYDPSLGFTTGGGWFYWPGTMDKTSFGYTMKYNRKRTSIQGSLLVIRHLEGAPEGEDKWRLKSNALEGLSLGDGGGFGWAAFSGKGTFKAPGADAEGNHSFTVYAEDAGDPGAGFDRFWIQTRNKTNATIPDLSLDAPAVDEAATIGGGNIFAPHGGGKGRP